MRGEGPEKRRLHHWRRPPPPPHRATTAHLQAIYPFVAPPPSRGGPLVGRDLMGGAFHFDPWYLYEQGILTNPNVLVLGQVGRGKSTFVKTAIRRHMRLGRQAWVLDPKGEYGALARSMGSVPVTLAPGGPVRLNPLAAAGDPERSGPARLELVTALAASSLGRPLVPEERAALEVAVTRLSARGVEPVLADLLGLLFQPHAEDAVRLGTTAGALAEEGRTLALELRRMVSGDLAGMFDGPTSGALDMSGPLVVVDLSAVYGSPALPLITTCATAWLRAMLTRGHGQRLVVLDEAWAVLSDLQTARWAQAGLKLARAHGVAHFVVAHRVSDLYAAGAEGTEQERLASGLLADTETRVLFGLAPSEAESSAKGLGLTSAERRILSRLPRGVALWRLADRSYLIEHCVLDDEWLVVDTDQAMRSLPETVA